MRAVVTGVAGFIGSHLAARLTAKGYAVTGIDRQPARPSHSYRHVSIDLADDPRQTGLAELIAGADVVFHLAARPGVRDGAPNLEKLRRLDNVLATANVLASTPPDAHVVATSSSSVYGGASLGQGGLVPSGETDTVRPVGGYAVSKVQMEQLCTRRRRLGGSTTVVRPFTVAGERQRTDMAFAIWLDALRRRQPITILGSGEGSRDITDVRDVVRGLIRAAELRVDDTVNLGTGVGHRLIEMARAIVEVTGIDGEIIHAPVSTDDVSDTLADTRHCERLLGFVPTTDLNAVLERMVEAAPLPALAVS